MAEITPRETIEELKLIRSGYPYPQTRTYKALSMAIEYIELIRERKESEVFE
jgi:hypothetical protein